MKILKRLLFVLLIPIIFITSAIMIIPYLIVGGIILILYYIVTEKTLEIATSYIYFIEDVTEYLIDKLT